MTEILFEVLCEEIPSRMQKDAQERWADLAQDLLKKRHIPWTHLETFATPRRLTLWVEGVPLHPLSSKEERKGPRVDAPFMAQEGFFRSVGLRPSECIKRETPKGTFWFAPAHQDDADVVSLLPGFFEDMLTTFSWPKTMLWGKGKRTWVRPIRRLLCLFNGEVVPYTFDPEGEPLHSASLTQGHRTLAPALFEVSSFKVYDQKLRDAFVILRREERRIQIQQLVQQVALPHQCAPHHEDMEEGALLDEVTGLVEWPVALLGQIDPRFMSLPQEVLETPMRNHQRYFPLHHLSDQKSAPFFAVIANNQAVDENKRTTLGNERVLAARLSDAQFYYEKDCRETLATHAESLRKRHVFKGLGTLWDKSERLQTLAKTVQPDNEALIQAAHIAKADLATGMVGEFPELQGIMGSLYAAREGYAAEVSFALRYLYDAQGIRPTGAPLSHQTLARLLGVMDRLDMLVGFFAIGCVPKGSKDPLALRRAGFGVVSLMVEMEDDFPLRSLAEVAYQAYAKHVKDSQPSLDCATMWDALASFLKQRLQYLLKEVWGLPHDHVVGALGASLFSQAYGFRKQAYYAHLFSEFLVTPLGSDLKALNNRVISFLKSERKKGTNLPVNDRILKMGVGEFDVVEEKALWEGFIPFLSETEMTVETLSRMAGLRPLVDAFFDQCPINDPDPVIREKRYVLLVLIEESCRRFANFSELEGVA